MQKYNDCHLYIYKWKPKKERVYIVARAQIGFYLEPRVLNFSIKKKRKKKKKVFWIQSIFIFKSEKKKKKTWNGIDKRFGPCEFAPGL